MALPGAAYGEFALTGLSQSAIIAVSGTSFGAWTRPFPALRVAESGRYTRDFPALRETGSGRYTRTFSLRPDPDAIAEVVLAGLSKKALVRANLANIYWTANGASETVFGVCGNVAAVWTAEGASESLFSPVYFYAGLVVWAAEGASETAWIAPVNGDPAEDSGGGGILPPLPGRRPGYGAW
jgi:hypothetical protein